MWLVPGDSLLTRSIYEKFYFQVSQAVSLFVGSLLLAIGSSGYFGVFLQPIEEISFLIEPMSFGHYYDQMYWIVLAFVGFWLVLFIWVRIAAIAAIGLIIFKWAALESLLTF